MGPAGTILNILLWPELEFLNKLPNFGILESQDLKVPKHEIFNGGFFASKEPIWSPDS
jgi:hypothetical protein